MSPRFFTKEILDQASSLCDSGSFIMNLTIRLGSSPAERKKTEERSRAVLEEKGILLDTGMELGPNRGEGNSIRILYATNLQVPEVAKLVFEVEGTEEVLIEPWINGRPPKMAKPEGNEDMAISSEMSLLDHHPSLEQLEIIDQLKDLSILISRHCPPASSQELKSLHKREVDLIDQLRGSIVRTRSVNMESTFEFLPTLSEKMGASMNKDIVLEMTGDRIEIDERNEMGLMMVLSHLLKYIVEEGKVIRGDRKFSNKAGGRICVSVFMIGHRAAISIEHRFHRINPCGQRNKPGDEADPLNASRSIVGRDRGNQYSRDVPSRDENYNPSLLADLIIVENMVKKLGWTLEAENSSGEGLGFLLMLQANPGTIPVMVVDINNVSYAMDLNYVHWGVRVTRDEVEGDIFRWR
ncbi:MAG: hypothetical protein MIO87_02715, partial [Methanomassiliicoccales archaeon]|nr:hypothetical protein [Methanomassiliicoccales archaeon]